MNRTTTLKWQKFEIHYRICMRNQSVYKFVSSNRFYIASNANLFGQTIDGCSMQGCQGDEAHLRCRVSLVPEAQGADEGRYHGLIFQGLVITWLNLYVASIVQSLSFATQRTNLLTLTVQDTDQTHCLVIPWTELVFNMLPHQHPAHLRYYDTRRP